MAEKIKITYSTMFSPNPELDRLYEEATARAIANMGQSFPMYIDGEERFAEERNLAGCGGRDKRGQRSLPFLA
jgi:hypothetical protein